MRMLMRMVAPLALLVMVPTVALAGGRPVTETCVNAGYRPGSPGFDMCVTRVSGDDPLSALEGGELEARSKGAAADKAADVDPLAAIVPAKPPLPGVAVPVAPAREEMPLSFNTPTVVGNAPLAPPPAAPPPAPNPAPAGTGSWWPTPPTAPTLPTPVAPSVPAWNFGTQ